MSSDWGARQFRLIGPQPELDKTIGLFNDPGITTVDQLL